MRFEIDTMHIHQTWARCKKQGFPKNTMKHSAQSPCCRLLKHICRWQVENDRKLPRVSQSLGIQNTLLSLGSEKSLCHCQRGGWKPPLGGLYLPKHQTDHLGLWELGWFPIHSPYKHKLCDYGKASLQNHPQKGPISGRRLRKIPLKPVIWSPWETKSFPQVLTFVQTKYLGTSEICIEKQLYVLFFTSPVPDSYNSDPRVSNLSPPSDISVPCPGPHANWPLAKAPSLKHPLASAPIYVIILCLCSSRPVMWITLGSVSPWFLPLWAGRISSGPSNAVLFAWPPPPFTQMYRSWLDH